MEDVKARRKALGWSRAELAQRAGVEQSVVALIERRAWSDQEAITRVERVLTQAEGGKLAYVLPLDEVPEA